jgi:hypothetical protein
MFKRTTADVRSNFAYKGRARSFGEGNGRRIDDSPSSVGDKKLESFSASFVSMGRGLQASVFFPYQRRPFSIFLRQLRERRGIIVHSPTVRTLLSARYACTCCVCVCMYVCVRGTNLCHTHISSFKSHVTTRSVDLLIWNRVRAGTLGKRLKGNNTGTGRVASVRMRAYVSRNELLWADRFFVSHVKIPRWDLPILEIRPDCWSAIGDQILMSNTGTVLAVLLVSNTNRRLAVLFYRTCPTLNMY